MKPFPLCLGSLNSWYICQVKLLLLISLKAPGLAAYEMAVSLPVLYGGYCWNTWIDETGTACVQSRIVGKC